MSTILIVDDEIFNLEIISEHLEDAGYETVIAENGLVAWSLLEETPDRFDAVLLDRMMPVMDGMEVLARIKSHPELKSLPIIMQTAKASKQDVLEGLQAGAFYYLIKPFDKSPLLAIVKTAVSDIQRLRALQKETEQTSKTLALMCKGEFKFRTLEEGQHLVTLLANAYPEAARVAIGLSELVINAVEHGNLGITYDEKSRLCQQDIWVKEVERRLMMPEYRGKYVTISFEREDEELRFLITDQGDGFEWEKYLEMDPDRAFNVHGRGIAMAKAISFDQIEYRGKGNEIEATIQVKQKECV